MAGLGAWTWWSTWPITALLAPLIVLLAILGSATLWMTNDPESSLRAHLTFALAVAATFFAQAVSISGRSYYTTDSAAFNQIATQLMIKGKNPYASSMMPEASRLLHGVSSYWTYTLSGGHVAKVSYPAGSFLFQAPLQLLGLHHLPSDWLDLAAGIVSAVILYLMLPSAVRWLSPALLLMAGFLGMFANGGTDALFLPFLLIAVWRWDRFADGATWGWARWIGPVSLGVACSIKQTPWFVVPFLVLGVALEAHSRRASLWRNVSSYAGAAAASFLVINLPFIVWSPSAWFRGTLLPLTDPLVPDGQGLVTLGLHGFVRGVHIGYLTVAGALAVTALLIAFVLWYSTLKRVWLFLLPLALFVPGRSLSEYLIDFFPAAIVAAFSVSSLDVVLWPGLHRNLRRALVAAPVAGTVGFAALAFTSPVLSISVDRVTTSDFERIYKSMTVTITNNSGTTVHPGVVVLENTSHPTGFWHLASGAPLLIAPHRTRTVTLYPPTMTLTSLRGQFWLIAAFVPSPASVSTSPPMRWLRGHP